MKMTCSFYTQVYNLFCVVTVKNWEKCPQVHKGAMSKVVTCGECTRWLEEEFASSVLWEMMCLS